MEPWTFKPARDIELSPVERARSLRRESGLVSTAGHLAWQLSTKAFFKLYHRLSITIERSVPTQPPFVMIANHTSHLDALVLAAALPCRLCDCVFPVAAGDVFFNALCPMVRSQARSRSARLIYRYSFRSSRGES